jgi:hypothetical protein
VDEPLTKINGTQPRMNANAVIADRAQVGTTLTSLFCEMRIVESDRHGK